MTAANDRAHDTDLLDALSQRVRNYFEAGADAVETNTVGCNLSDLGDHDIAGRIRELSATGIAIVKRVGVDRGDKLGVQTSIE